MEIDTSAPQDYQSRPNDRFFNQQEQDDEFRRVEDSLTAFRNFARTLSMALLGTQSDKFIMRLNKFAMNVYNVR